VDPVIHAAELARFEARWYGVRVHRTALFGRQPEAEHHVADTVVRADRRLPGRFWLYAAFTATSMAGFATFGVLSFHMQARHVLADGLIPVTYAAAKGAAA
jgi:hypothetical protein